MPTQINRHLAWLQTSRGAGFAAVALASFGLLSAIAGRPFVPNATPAAGSGAIAAASALATSPVPAAAPVVLSQTAAPSAGAGVGSPIATGGFSKEQEEQIKRIIKDYLVSHPEVMMEVQAALDVRMEKIRSEQLKSAISEHSSDIYRSTDSPTTGNLSGDVTVVEFFDYNCGYCKKAFGDLAKLIQKDARVKVVFKELPILSKGSEEAAKVALAAKVQGKYWEVHRALLEARGQMNEAAALKLAEKTGVDMAQLRSDMASDAVKHEIERVRDLAQKMGIQGTPHFLIGEKAIPGAPENLFEQLTQHVADVRKEGCKVC